MSRTVLPILLAPLACLSCDDAAIDPSQSLVGAERLPSARALARETLYIHRGAGPDGDALAYEWYPDNVLTITHTFSDDRSTGEIVKGKETLRVSPEIASQARQLLWRVRPARLEGVGQDARPTGCERRGPHDSGDVTVVFINEGEDAGTDDDQAGVFNLPSPESCNTPAAVEARTIVWRALQLLPRSRVAVRFDRSG